MISRLKQWRKDNPEKVREQKRRYYQKHKETILAKQSKNKTHLRSAYGITKDEYAEILSRQGGKCAICGDTASTFHLDHDHSTGVIRGVLCCHCNRGLGGFKDSISSLEHAIQYLKESK